MCAVRFAEVSARGVYAGRMRLRAMSPMAALKSARNMTIISNIISRQSITAARSASSCVNNRTNESVAESIQ